MKIEIIRGIYGHCENGRLMEKNAASGPFEVSAKEGKRLISLGVARKPAVDGRFAGVQGKREESGEESEREVQVLDDEGEDEEDQAPELSPADPE